MPIVKLTCKDEENSYYGINFQFETITDNKSAELTLVITMSSDITIVGEKFNLPSPLSGENRKETKKQYISWLLKAYNDAKDALQKIIPENVEFPTEQLMHKERGERQATGETSVTYRPRGIPDEVLSSNLPAFIKSNLFTVDRWEMELSRQTRRISIKEKGFEEAIDLFFNKGILNAEKRNILLRPTKPELEKLIDKFEKINFAYNQYAYPRTGDKPNKEFRFCNGSTDKYKQLLKNTVVPIKEGKKTQLTKQEKIEIVTFYQSLIP